MYFCGRLRALRPDRLLRCARYGEKSIECAPAFYHYGLALTHKARLETKVACSFCRLAARTLRSSCSSLEAIGYSGGSADNGTVK